MADNFLGPKPARSVMAFLWMPQLNLSFRHMSHLAPVFMRTLASVFVAAGLLPRNHPALMYGIEGVRKYGVSEVIGEAWFNLRTTRATSNQWGLFIGVMLMFAMIIGVFLTFFMTVAFGVGATAQAQLFSHPRGNSSFGSNGYTNDPSTDPFDRMIPAPGTPAGDYGIMMLDKVVRAGANNQGGALQRALQDLMLVYNSGILVIASVIIFWMIINIVVDTAKSGQVGGGRHNMVWLPIRIVFALGLLIPLGSTGFSSGQFMVMKLAEWGSNFGTNAWVAYVEGVANNTALIAGGRADYAGEAVVSFTKMWMCRISANANLSIASNDLDEFVREKHVITLEDTPINERGIQGGPSMPVSETVYFEQEGTRGMCGSISFPAAGRRPPNSTSRPLDQAMQRLRSDMALAFYTHLRTVEPQIISFACDFAAGQSELDGRVLLDESGSGVSELLTPKVLGDWTSCARSTGSPSRRPADGQKAGLQRIVDQYQGLVRNDYNRALQQFRSSQNELINEMTERGWAGMGVFYSRISEMNAAVFEAQRPSSIITVGGIEDMDTREDSISNLWGLWDNDTQWIKDTQGTLRAFHDWWTAVDDGARVTRRTEGVDSKAASNADMKRDTTGALTRQMGFVDQNLIISLLADEGPENLNKSPLAVISSIGDILFWGPVTAFTALIVLQAIAAGGFGWVTGGGAPMVIGQFINFMMSAFLPLMFAGLMLKFYLPLIPFIRVLMSVLTWIISVFEAIVMVPIAALAHLTSQGEGLAGGADAAWKLWLNILLRPVLTVMGFVGAILVFNSFASYANGAFYDMYMNKKNSEHALNDFVNMFVFAMLYTFIMYTIANTVFKMLDLIPDALSRWYGVPRDASFDGINEGSILAGQLLSRMKAPQLQGKKKDEKPPPPPPPPGPTATGVS